jgi:polysaccharide export outer membrane protein
MQFVRSRLGGVPMTVIAGGLALVALSLGGCSNKGGPVPYNVQNFGAPDAPSLAGTTNTYRIGPQDILGVTVYRVPNLSGDLEVDGGGNVVMPLLGSVAVAGKTNTEVQADIAQKPGAKYLQNPEVQVVVKASPRQKVTVDGSVKSAGVFPIPGGTTTLLQALALSQGPTDDANMRRIVVFRTIGGQRNAAAFDAIDIRRGLAPDPVIYGNDIIIVDGSRSRAIFKDLTQSLPLIAIFRPF